MNKTLLRNLVIILVLVVALVFTYGLYQKRQEDVAERLAENARIDAENKRKEEQKRLNAQQESLRPRPTPNSGNTSGQSETLEDSLVRLKSSLKAGDRSEFPKGTKEIGGVWYLTIQEKMNWIEAWKYADEFGARLAIFTTASALEDVGFQNVSQSPAWVGAGDHGNGTFRWVDGAKWRSADGLEKKNHMAALSPLGMLVSKDARDRLPFVLQWTPEQSPVGSVSGIKQTFDPSMDPAMVGTVRVGEQSYAIIPGAADWSQARKIARSMQGTLAVPSSVSEVKFLLNLVQYRLPEGQSAWIGGKTVDDAWQWSTGEKGLPVKTQTPAIGAALALSAGSDQASLSKFDSVKPLGYFIVEWGGSADSLEGDESEPGESKVTAATVEEMKSIKDFRLKARQAAGKIVIKREKALKANAKDMTFDLRTWYRGLNSNDQRAYNAMSNALSAAVTETEVPEGLDLGNLPEKVQAMYGNHLRNQNRILSEAKEGMSALQAAYLKKLGEMKLDADKENRSGFSKALSSEIERAGGGPEAFERFIGR